MARFVPNITHAQKSFLLRPMELLRDVGDVQCCFDAFEDGSNPSVVLCTVCAEHPTGSKSFLLHPMELLGDVGDVQSCFDAFGDSANPSAILWHGLCRTSDRLRNHFCCTRWNS